MSKSLLRHLLFAVGVVLVLVPLGVAQKTAKPLFDGKSWWDHVKVIADDSMEGRETGSLGLRKAEAYAVERVRRAGLEPAGTDGYYQKIKFVQRQIDEKNSFAFLASEGQPSAVSLGEDAYFSTRVEGTDQEISAALVLAGNGLQVPENNVDELAGLDLGGESCGVCCGIAFDSAELARGALWGTGAALEALCGSGRGGNDRHSKSRFHGHPLAATLFESRASFHGSGRSRVQRSRRPENFDDIQSGIGGKIIRRFGPHV